MFSVSSCYTSEVASGAVRYLQVNALSESIIGIYLHEFTSNERGISIKISSALTFLLFKLNALHKETLTNRQTLSQLKPLCNDRGVLIYTTAITPR